ncbi:MAG: tyrosine-protein phosphatase, partial [Kiritimatiellae bacterium]|nr:tyrosine-protein phosphatase [Kiritimatiellia bacterium]
KGEWKPGKSRLTEAGKKTALEKLGLKTDLDLRSDVECWGMTGSPLGDTVLWKQISFGHYDQFEKHAKYRDAVKEVFAVLADPARRPLVFHCIGGADRTGGLAFFIQALCDVDDDTLVKDWELTCCYTARSSFVHEKCIDRFLAMLAKYPGATTKERVRAFLRECGVTDAQMDAVRSALLPVE